MQTNASPDNFSESNRPLFLAHFMPWYQTPNVSGYWGWHWTMNHFDPEKMNADGRREIASHYYPLTGPYDSMDEDNLEYQVLLMRLAGIDGVLVDWYGMEDFWDYAVLNQSTHALFAAAQKAKLLFAIVYEDQTIKHMVDNQHLSQSDALAHGAQVMKYMQDNWFESDTYVKLANRPVLLNFGPQYFAKSSDWETMFAGLTNPPLFFTLDNRLAPAATGAYPWPPMWKANSSGILTRKSLDEYLNMFYQKASRWDYLVTGAFPAFNDIYEEAGLGYGYGVLDPENGDTFRATLQQAIDHDPDIIQLVTWNDYGEGTIIEPTEEFGNQYLKMVQDARSLIDSAFTFQHEDLRLPLRIYTLRKENKGDMQINSSLDNVFDLVISGAIDEATGIVNSISGSTRIHDAQQNPGSFFLLQNYPNPFNPRTIIRYSIPTPMKVKISFYNIAGQLVKVLVNEYKNAGHHEAALGAENLSSGLYFYKMTAGRFSMTRKCLRIQ